MKKHMNASDVMVHKKPLWKRISCNWSLYLLIAFPVLVLFIYKYLPMLGTCMAFQDYNVFDGFSGSEWVGLEHFQRLFQDPKFFSILGNTLIYNAMKFVFQFPLPIILALLLNEMRKGFIKSSVQTLTYLLHFLSWVVIYGIFTDLLLPSGFVNTILTSLGIESVDFLGNPQTFRWVVLASYAWKDTGWSAIVYLSALSAIDTQLYDAASVDGAGRLRQTWHVTLPGISGTIVFIVILRISSMLASDTEQLMLFLNPLVYSTGDMLGTFIYREGVQNASYSYSTAVGLFTSVISMVLLYIAHKVSVKFTGNGIW